MAKKKPTAKSRSATTAKSKPGRAKPGQSKSGHTSPVKPAAAQSKSAQSKPVQSKEPQSKPASGSPPRPRPPETKPASKPERSAIPTLLFYHKPIALNREAHKNLKVRSVPSFAYAAAISSVPLTVNEFAAAARTLPILFVPDPRKQPTPIALLGLQREQNLFIEADGRWTGNYIPAFIRRYPFVLIDTDKPNDFTVGIDSAYPGFNTEVGEPMFGEDGSEGPGLKRAIEFLNAYRIDAGRTQDFVAQVQRLDLLIPRALNVQHQDGSKYNLDGFFVVDEQRLGKLDEKEAGALLRSGHLALIYMHLLSLHNLTDLSSRLETRAAEKKSA